MPHTQVSAHQGASITVFLNGDPYATAACSLAALILQLDLTQKRFAIEVDGQLIGKSHYATFELKNGQRIEIVQAIGGG